MRKKQQGWRLSMEKTVFLTEFLKLCFVKCILTQTWKNVKFMCTVLYVLPPEK